MAELKIKYDNKDELLKILSKLHSIIASGKDIPIEMSKEDLDVIHIVNDLYKGNTLCELTIANGVRTVNMNQIHKMNCPECKAILKKLEDAKSKNQNIKIKNGSVA